MSFKNSKEGKLELNANYSKEEIEQFGADFLSSEMFLSNHNEKNKHLLLDDKKFDWCKVIKIEKY